VTRGVVFLQQIDTASISDNMLKQIAL